MAPFEQLLKTRDDGPLTSYPRGTPTPLPKVGSLYADAARQPLSRQLRPCVTVSYRNATPSPRTRRRQAGLSTPKNLEGIHPAASIEANAAEALQMQRLKARSQREM
jgi:hypothetical protein